MSVIANYARLNDNSLDSLRANPNWMEALYAKAIPNAEVIDIDKACDGIIWLLSRLPAPPHADAANLAATLWGTGGVSEPQLKASYGPASLLSPQQAAELSAWLQSVDPAQMRSLYDPHAMDSEQVYPQIWSEEGVAAFDDYLLPNCRALQAFFSRAAGAQQHVLVFFT